MALFPHAHATHPDWGMACALVLAQLRAQMAQPAYASEPSLGLLYITDHFVGQAQAILDHLQAELPGVTDWAGTVGVGIIAPQAEYMDEPALALMLLDVPADQYRVFSGVAPLPADDLSGFVAHTALVHADAQTPDLPDLLAELSERTQTGYLFGGLTSSRGRMLQFAVAGNGNISGQGAAPGVFAGGLSGVAFGAQVPIVSRVTQGCQPISRTREITAVTDRHLLLTLDGLPALQVLLDDLQVRLDQPQEALQKVRATLVGLGADGQDPVRQTGHLGSEVRVRHIIGLDPQREGIAVAEELVPGMRLAFCQRHVAAARADLVRVCAEIREELEPQDLPLAMAQALAAPAAESAPHPARRMAGAVYVSCVGRGGAHFGGPNAELQIVRHALGDVPLVGFFASGEIAHHHLYGYTGVLTVFVDAG